MIIIITIHETGSEINEHIRFTVTTDKYELICCTQKFDAPVQEKKKRMLLPRHEYFKFTGGVSDRSFDSVMVMTVGLRSGSAEHQRSSRSTLPWQLPEEVTAAPTSRAGLGTSMAGGAWNARTPGSELAFRSVAARF